jgi:hypothetical protein
MSTGLSREPPTPAAHLWWLFAGMFPEEFEEWLYEMRRI